MIAEDRDGGRPEVTNVTQDLEGVGTAIDQIADKPEPVPLGIELDGIRQVREGGEAALDVADSIGGHGGPRLARPGLLRKSGGMLDEALCAPALAELAGHLGTGCLVGVH